MISPRTRISEQRRCISATPEWPRVCDHDGAQMVPASGHACEWRLWMRRARYLPATAPQLGGRA
eukprot:COSAG01_NODE_801_length_13466_cov_585.329693_5_plen_64_part_00